MSTPSDEAATATELTVEPAVEPGARPRPAAAAVLVPIAAGTLVAVALGVYGRLHEPAFVSINIAGFSGPQAVKSWLTTAALALALFQLGSSLVMWGKVPGVVAPPWIGAAHRWSGRLAVLATVPVAVHCLYALGFQSYEPRVVVHSLLGCFFYGAFLVKMLLLGRHGTPGWALPVIGGLTFTGLTGLWLTSSLWFFTTSGLTF